MVGRSDVNTAASTLPKHGRQMKKSKGSFVPIRQRNDSLFAEELFRKQDAISRHPPKATCGPLGRIQVPAHLKPR